MFTSARIKLTSYYLAIIMAISLIFSAVIYSGFIAEFRKGLLVHSQTDCSTPLGDICLWGTFENDIFNQGRNRILVYLGIINLSILLVSGVGGFFLAGRTLKPIEDMVEEQKRFTADASHELRTPLTALKTEIEVALRAKKLGLSKAKKLLKSNLEEVDKIQALSNHLLDLNRYQNSQVKLRLEPVNFKEIIEDTLDKLKPVARKKGITFKASLPEISVAGNATALGQLALILIDNAIKYSYSKGEVTVNLKKRGYKAVLEVSDQGVGIKKTDLPLIFNRFYRTNSARTKETTPGYGLGLSIAKSIVELHRGDIRVDSHLGKGSKFQVYLRLVK